MTVYVDNFNLRADVPNGTHTIRGVWCHMTADTTEELLAMAKTIGLRSTWIQHPGQWHEHFDVTKTKRALAIKAGAVEVEALAHTRNFLQPRREAMGTEVRGPNSTGQARSLC